MEAKVELLAPAGTWQAFVAVIAAGADAVYLGGKRFNMRMHRQEYNFDDQQLEKAVKYAHQRNVKVYITVNNLLADRELGEVKGFLLYLNEIGVDAIIIQDLMFLDLLKDLEINYEIHASVMMNTSNLDTLHYLRNRGVTRIVTSREMTLEQLKKYRQEIDCEFEYFIHGDMCYAQSGQCLQSGILFGESSNQGKCLKPCRWPLRIVGAEEFKYHLAVKDMCLFYNLKELMASGVHSFKVEGRMRSPEFLEFVISRYRQEIDRYLKDPSAYEVDPVAGQEIFAQRVREFSTCFALGHPGPDFIDQSGIREPKIFSRAIKESEISQRSTKRLKEKLQQPLATKKPQQKARLSVTVPTFDHFQAVLQTGVDRVIIAGDLFRPHKPWSKTEIALALKLGKMAGREVIYRTPSIIMESEMDELKQLFADFSDYHLRVMTGNIGVIEALYSADLKFSLYGDWGLNVFNTQTCKFLKTQGFESVIISLEAGVQEIQQIGQLNLLEIEILTQGPLQGMVSDSCLKYNRDGICKLPCDQGIILEDEAGCFHRVEIDQYCRNHIFLQNQIALMPVLGELALNGINRFRIAGTFYSPGDLVKIIELYTKVIRFDYDSEVISDGFSRLQEICQVPLTYGALVNKR